MKKPPLTAPAIWHPAKPGVNEHVQFLDNFCLARTPESTLIRVSADSRYVLWLNGHRIGLGPYPDFPAHRKYDSFDVTELVVLGDNQLAVLVNHFGEDSSVYCLGEPFLFYEALAEGETLCRCGSETLCRQAPDYHSGPCERVSSQLSFSFRYDARSYDGWNRSGYCPGADWMRAVNRPEVQLARRPIEDMVILPPALSRITAQGLFKNADILTEQDRSGLRMHRAFLSAREPNSILRRKDAPVEITEDGLFFVSDDPGSDGVYLLVDLGQEECGYLLLDADLPCGTRVDIGYGEHLDDLRVRSATEAAERNFAAVYTAPGGRFCFTHLLKPVGCRYIQLHLHSAAGTLYAATLLPERYPATEKLPPVLPDALHAKIYETCLHTLRLCMHEHYEDCPWREQALYALDARSQMLCGYYAFQGFDYPRQALRLLAEGLREDGLLELCAPAKVRITIPAFSLAWVLALGEYRRFSGDAAFAQEMRPVAERILDTFRQRLENGLLPCFREPEYWNFYDWAEGLDGGEILREIAIAPTLDAPLNAFYALALQSAADLYGGEYRAWARDINACLFERFYDDGNGLLATFICSGSGERRHHCQLTQSLAICCGAVPEAHLDGILTALATNVNLVPLTLPHYIFKYDALMTRPEQWRDTVRWDIERVWGGMLFRGATSFWETEQGGWAFENAGSLCHGWSAVPIYMYGAYSLF